MPLKFVLLQIDMEIVCINRIVAGIPDPMHLLSVLQQSMGWISCILYVLCYGISWISEMSILVVATIVNRHNVQGYLGETDK